MQARVRELHLRLDADGTRDAKPGRSLREKVQQRRLANPGLAAQDQHRALPCTDARQQPFQRGALVAAVAQHGEPGSHYHGSGRRGGRTMRGRLTA